MKLKTPKGTVDESPRECFLYEEIVEKVRSIFTLHGAVPISTPVFEMKDILVNKYGEDTKLIYDLKDQGGEICALRYDLTVPFARYLVMNNVRRIKRYQIGKVYRRDNPSVTKGRLREFVQADFDIAGECVPMVADAEVVCCIDRILASFDAGEFKIKVNDRRILASVLVLAGVEEEMHATVCSTIDKISKMSWEELKREFVAKGLGEEQVETIKGYMEMAGSDVLQTLKRDRIYELEKGRAGIDDLEELLRLCRVLGCDGNIVVDMSLARGLDYYTGLIIEAEYADASVGSVIGGGRYDNLTKSLAERDSLVPCVGFSVGVSRIFALLSEKHTRESSSLAYVGASGGQFLEERLRILRKLWDAGIPSETFYTKRSSFGDQQTHCRKKGIRFIVVVGESELAAGSAQILDLLLNLRETIEIDDVAGHIRSR